MNENDIEIRIKNGDENAFEELLREFAPVVSSIIYRMSGGRLPSADAEEIVSDTFFTLWVNRKNIADGCMNGYIIRIAKNKARNRLKELGRNTFDNIDEYDFCDVLTVPAEAENRCLAEIIDEAVGELEASDREIFLRHDYYYQTADEMAQIMKINRNTVYTRLHRTRKKLKKLLQERGIV